MNTLNRNTSQSNFGGRTQTDPKTGRITATVDELAVYNTLLLQALVELLFERGLLVDEEIRERVKKLRDEVTVKLQRPQ